MTGGRVGCARRSCNGRRVAEAGGRESKQCGNFFRALVEKDVGRMAAFYWTMSHADAAHQQYFLKSAERGDRYYQWFRESLELKTGILVHVPGMASEILQELPLDSAGNIRFPGGQSAWFPGTELPLGNPLLEALVPVAKLEQKRGGAFDEQTAGLLGRNHKQWAALYPYFEKPCLRWDARISPRCRRSAIRWLVGPLRSPLYGPARAIPDLEALAGPDDADVLRQLAAVEQESGDHRPGPRRPARSDASSR